jgi:hypothetical protein
VSVVVVIGVVFIKTVIIKIFSPLDRSRCRMVFVAVRNRQSGAPSLVKSAQSAPLPSDAGTYYSILEDIVRRPKLQHTLNVDLRQDGGGHGCKITVRYGFSSDTPYPSKKEAEESASKAAVDALDADAGGGNLAVGKMYRSYLNEFYQKNPDIGKPEYRTLPDKVGPYESVVYLNVVGEASNCESEVLARNTAARGILDKLRLVPAMSRLLSDSRFTEVEYEVNERDGKYQAAMSASFMFEAGVQEPGYDKPKTAKKYAAQQVLRRLYPEARVENIDNCVNLLQERNPSKFPVYEDVRVDDKYKCHVRVNFRMSDTCHHDCILEAKEAVTKKTLVRVGIGD